MVNAGKYTAKVSDYTVQMTKAGLPYVKVWFDVEGQGSVPWNGYLTEKTQESTMKVLTYMGFTGSDLGVLADGLISGALDRNATVNITVEHEADPKDSTKRYAKVRFVNHAGGTVQVKTPQETAEAKTKLQAFTGALKKVQADLGVKNTAADIKVPF